MTGPMSCPDLYILRHGETEWNRTGRWQGRLDSPLTPLGEAQAREQGLLLADLALDPEQVALYVSPQGRAARTAEIVAEVAGWTGPIRTDDRLREIDVGDWTGKLRDEIRAEADLPGEAHFLEYYAAAPAAEGFASMEARARAFLDDLAGPAVIVTHGITSRFLRAVALGLDVADGEALPGGQGCIHRVSRGTHATLAPEDTPA